MKIEYHDKKSDKNDLERGLPFDLVYDFDFDNALISRDERHTKEIRMKAIGKIEKDFFTLIYTKRNGVLRVISLRPASKRERLEHESQP